MNPLISIIIPVYNSEKYLKECLDSIINQTYNNLEIVIINDGSTDNSLEIIKSYKDSRIKLINQENKGVSYSRNVGISNSTGEWIMFVDSDDYLKDNNTLENLIGYCKNCDVVRYNFLTIKNNSNSNDNFVCNFKDTYINGESFLIDVLNNKKDYGWYLWQYIFKKELWSDIKFPNVTICEDMSTIYKVLLKANKVNVCKDVIYCYRENSGSETKNTSLRKCNDLLDVIINETNNTESINIPDELKILLKNNFSYSYISELIVVNLLNKEEKEIINNRLKENSYICNNCIYGKQRIIMKLTKIFGISFMERILNIRRLLKD